MVADFESWLPVLHVPGGVWREKRTQLLYWKSAETGFPASGAETSRRPRILSRQGGREHGFGLLSSGTIIVLFLSHLGPQRPNLAI